MKKYLIIFLVGFCVYLFGKVSYELARPAGDVRMKLNHVGTSTAVLDLTELERLNRRIVGPVLPDSNLYGMKKFGEGLWLHFAKNESDDQKLRVEFLNRRLAEAQVLLEQGKSGLAEQSVNKFSIGSMGLLAELKKQDLLRKDPKQATLIEESIAKQIVLQKNLMINIGSSSPLYQIKAKILALEVEMADSNKDKADVLAMQAKEKMIKVIASGNSTSSPQMTDWQIIKDGLHYFYSDNQNYLALKFDWFVANTNSFLKGVNNSLESSGK